MLKDWIVIIVMLAVIGLALLAYLCATQKTEPEPPTVQESEVLRVEVIL